MLTDIMRTCQWSLTSGVSMNTYTERHTTYVTLTATRIRRNAPPTLKISIMRIKLT